VTFDIDSDCAERSGNDVDFRVTPVLVMKNGSGVFVMPEFSIVKFPLPCTFNIPFTLRVAVFTL